MVEEMPHHSGRMRSHFDLPPSPWVRRWSAFIRPGGAVLDVACGAGRHARWLAGLGFEVEAVDRAPELFESPPPGVTVRGADLEGASWPYEGRRFDAIVVTNYLHRPLMPHLIASLESGGLLVYETFARGHERFGKPSNPEYLLAPGELLLAVAGQLRVLGYEDLVVDDPRPAAVQRLCARRE
jgi:SAM-dependent methyltransferase